MLESGEGFTCITDLSDIGNLSYYCTLHPWMNGIITILDPEGMPVGRVAESGSAEVAQKHIEEAKSFVKDAKDFEDTVYDNEAAISYIQAAINYHEAAVEYSLLEDHADPTELVFKKGLEIAFKSTTKEPVYVKPETLSKLVVRGWALEI